MTIMDGYRDQKELRTRLIHILSLNPRTITEMSRTLNIPRLSLNSFLIDEKNLPIKRFFILYHAIASEEKALGINKT